MHMKSHRSFMPYIY